MMGEIKRNVGVYIKWMLGSWAKEILKRMWRMKDGKRRLWDGWLRGARLTLKMKTDGIMIIAHVTIMTVSG